MISHGAPGRKIAGQTLILLIINKLHFIGNLLPKKIPGLLFHPGFAFCKHFHIRCIQSIILYSLILYNSDR